ncbi:N-lysine methyltransferase KMT5A-B-like isoform X2 [Hydractinia symbiolongicarpus]|uniref:N-lysine methyltransferase KMT5A-B-like isoform X2 n=1 Tax=Hydractinia symbiolongicarpus TaxID=13093 RepID=UPI00254FB8B8|nr:N-lysine methyltransferase KMT5A-B-like isoform X2 [Hydractinia symbiolongicarpus]
MSNKVNAESIGAKGHVKEENRVVLTEKSTAVNVPAEAKLHKEKNELVKVEEKSEKIAGDKKKETANDLKDETKKTAHITSNDEKPAPSKVAAKPSRKPQIKETSSKIKETSSRGKSTKKISTNKKKRTVHDQEIPDKTQSTLTQHFQVRRSERKLKSTLKEEKQIDLERKILSGVEDHLEIRLIESKGRGVFSKRKLSKGDFVCEYVGDLVDVKEARCREAEYEKDPKFGCYMYFFDYKNKKYCVDATKESGKIGRLLNHSKTQSNVCTKLFPIGETPHLILVASKEIALDEELLYDYGDRSKSAIESHPWLKT